jgi:hypothetical protein
VIADILAASRTLAQRTLERVRRVELTLGVEPSHYEPGAGDRARPATTGAAAGRATGKAAAGGPGTAAGQSDRETVEA